MCDALVWSIDAVASIDWLAIVEALAAMFTAIIAGLALKTWRRQDKAQIEAAFLDALIEATHTFVAEIPKPITLLEMAKIGMESHAPTSETGDEAGRALKGAIAYIQRNGEHDAKRLLDVLEMVQPSVIKLRSLAAKGQVFKFGEYAKCQNAVARLTWQFDRIEAFMAAIGSPTWNWDHPEADRLLKDVMKINPNEIREGVKQNNISLIEFASDNYKRIYG